jgi:hypothetical protein
MPYMQRRRLTVDSDISGNATWRYKLPKVGKFTALEIRLACQRLNTRTLNTVVYPLETQITKIELLRQATRPIISLTGEQLDAMNYWDFKRPNARRYRQEEAAGCDLNLFLLAGRDFYDREYGYDMAKLGETYLEITHTLTADTTDKFDVDTSALTVYAWQWMGPGQPNFKGYFRTRQLAHWTTTGTSTIKVMAEVQEYGLYNEIGGIDYLVASTVMDLPYWWSYIESIGAQNYGAVGQPVINIHGITLPMRLQATTAVAGEAIFSARGCGFQKCLRIGFDHERDGFDLPARPGLRRPHATKTAMGPHHRRWSSLQRTMLAYTHHCLAPHQHTIRRHLRRP